MLTNSTGAAQQYKRIKSNHERSYYLSPVYYLLVYQCEAPTRKYISCWSSPSATCVISDEQNILKTWLCADLGPSSWDKSGNLINSLIINGWFSPPTIPLESLSQQTQICPQWFWQKNRHFHQLKWAGTAPPTIPQHQRINRKVIGLKISKTLSLYPISLECISNHYQAFSTFLPFSPPTSHSLSCLFVSVGRRRSFWEVDAKSKSTFQKLNSFKVFFFCINGLLLSNRELIHRWVMNRPE